MTDESLSERARVAYLAADRARRTAVTYVMRSPLYRWRLMGARPNQLLLIPQDLRTSDPSFVAEVQEGHFGLAGKVVQIWDQSPFVVRPPSAGWAERLHGFSWLRHLRADENLGGHELAREFVTDWIGLHRTPRGLPFAPEITARRIISWLSNAAMLIEVADQKSYEQLLRSLDLQITHLSASYRDAPAGIPRLTALSALIMSGLCVSDLEPLIEQHLRAFCDEIDTQILPWGGHVGRNPSALIEPLLDFLPMTQCFKARNMEPPPSLTNAVQRALGWLRAMRLGDGHIARFNGVGPAAATGLATLLAYDDGHAPVDLATPETGYVRMQAARTIVLVDAGGAPPLEVSHEAHAGCLAFELSVGPHPLIVNCGAPGSGYPEWRTLARGTTAHSTLSIDGVASGRLIQPRFYNASDDRSLTGPAKVSCTVIKKGAATEINTAHDGYLDRFGLVHTRLMRLGILGDALDGCDRLAHPNSSARIKGDVSYSVHFHLHPDVICRRGDAKGTADFTLLSGEEWRLACKEPAEISIEESTFLADASGPRQSVQVVLRGRCLDRAEVHWRLYRTTAAPSTPGKPPIPRSRPATGETVS